MSNKENASIKRGTKNVFADLGYADAATHLLKAQLVSRIDDIVREQKLTQTQAAQIMGLSQPDVSRLLKGQFREISVERIMRILTRLGCEVDIVIKPPGCTVEGSVIHLQQAQSEAV
jgi:predicted XRE-type DNA-binding protein